MVIGSLNGRFVLDAGAAGAAGRGGTGGTEGTAGGAGAARTAGTALVVGAGVGGIATAIGPRRAGWAVTVLERRAAPERYGTAFGIHPTAQTALDRLGLGEALRARASWPTPIRGPGSATRSATCTRRSPASPVRPVPGRAARAVRPARPAPSRWPATRPTP
ncbi:FAD-dependent oxidoreductase [Streptomyces sp. NPDC054961]